ncbi:MAG: hypothetical protein ACE5PV_18650 [Candidatus Poribacteria bacterium]
MESTKSTTIQNNLARVRAVVNVNDGAYSAQKQVNIQIMRKIGQLVIALRPEELLVFGGNIYWKVPLCVVNLSGDEEKHLLKSYALVDAVSGVYTMSDEFAAKIKEESTTILQTLYPELKEWEKRVKEGD